MILPDLNAGCSMADMAEISQVEACWEALERLGLTADTIPLTYMNSTAAIKAFCGERGGLVCTSSNARAAFEWAFARGKRILFLPDQHLGRNTGFAMGIPLDEMAGLGSLGSSRAARRQTGSGRQPHSAVEGPLRRASALSAQPCRRGARQISRHPGHRASRVPLGGLPESRRAGLDRAAHQDRRRGPGGHRCSRSEPRFTWSTGWRSRFAAEGKRIITPRRSPAACAPPCTASARSIWPGRSRTWSKAAWSTTSRCARA